MEEEIICEKCGWTGDSTMLVSKRGFNYCPHCGSDKITEIED